MIVEDNAELRRVAVKLLSDLGYFVCECDNAQTAIGILKDKDDIDLVFTDVVMPGGMTGFELAKAAKELRPNLKVLLTTGYSELFVKNGNAHGGDVDVIGKPYRKHDLAVKIRSILNTKG